jgi:DNA-damage-inducible protein J
LLDNVAHPRYIRDESEANMSKTATVRARLEPSLKERAEEILQSLGLSTTQAITLYYKQIEMNNGLPFDVVVPSALTKRTMDGTDSGEGLILCEDAEDMFKKLGL